MILISHRGNISGKDLENENKPDYILNAINLNYNVEIDVWKYKDKLYLGHDEPLFKFDKNLLNYSSCLWFHAKNLDALQLLDDLNVHYYWHQKDDITITSKGYWWTYPGKKLFKNSICVLPELHKQDLSICAGYCSDLIEKYK